jgi:quercetin dioxygenase-like cupin family protein
MKCVVADSIEYAEPRRGVFAKDFVGDKVRLRFYHFPETSEWSPIHSVPEETVCYVLEGEMIFRGEDMAEPVRLTKGMFYVVSADERHTAMAVKGTLVLAAQNLLPTSRGAMKGTK